MESIGLYHTGYVSTENQGAQVKINAISPAILPFMRAIPTFIGYDCYSQDYLVKHLLKENPSIKSLTIFDKAEYFKAIKTHLTYFDATVDKTGKIALQAIFRSKDLKAVALEFDMEFSEESIQRLPEQQTDATFKIQITWDAIASTYNGNYSQMRYDQSYPLTYDIHTHSCYQRREMEVLDMKNLSLETEDVVRRALHFLNQRDIQSPALLTGGGCLDAELLSAPLLKTHKYTYI